jgi:putative transcriptional regulator
MTIDSNEFSDLVKNVRKQLGTSQEEFAYILGVSFSTISRWENRKTMPSKLALSQFDTLCKKMVKQGKLNLPGEKRYDQD